MIKKQLFGTINNQDVFIYTLDNGNGLKAEILSYGGIIKSLAYNGIDVVLGRDTLNDYLNNEGYFGALIGRNANRIEGAAFSLNGKNYTLAKNDGNNNLHGGNKGFDSKIWDCEELDMQEPQLTLHLISPDGEEGFPGTAEIQVTYTLTQENSLKIHYEAACDQDTVLNLTNHTYFNLNGHESGSVENHSMQINASFYTPNTPECFPNGEILSVEGTAFDLRAPKKLKNGFESKHPQIMLFDGYDHNFVLDGCGYRLAAIAIGDKTGICMETYTDQPGVQLYTGNGINAATTCKQGCKYAPHHAFCLETQVFPNALKFAHFPSSICPAGIKYDTCTEYKFSLCPR